MQFREVLTNLSERFKVSVDEVQAKVMERVKVDYKSSWQQASEACDWEIVDVSGEVRESVKVFRNTKFAKISRKNGSWSSGFLVGTRECKKLDLVAAKEDGVDMRNPDALVRYMKKKIELVVG